MIAFRISLLFLLLVTVALLTRHRRVPLSAVLVVVGLLLSSAGALPALDQLEGETFQQVVLFLLLPALVFSAALGSDLRTFVRNLRPLLALAILAFLLSAVLVGLAVHLVLSVPLVVALLFRALISATDPVAVVSVIRRLGVPRRLLVLVEGESLLNDGVAIVLSSVLLAGALGMTTSPVASVGEFAAVFVGGALIGLALGALGAVLLPWLDPLPAVALTLAVAYGGFALAEDVLGFSGVIATAVAGLVLSGLAPSRASAAVREAWRHTWDTLDYLANGLLFLLIGVALQVAGLVDNASAIALVVVVVLIARTLPWCRRYGLAPCSTSWLPSSQRRSSGHVSCFDAGSARPWTGWLRWTPATRPPPSACTPVRSPCWPRSRPRARCTNSQRRVCCPSTSAVERSPP